MQILTFTIIYQCSDRPHYNESNANE